jgi:TyrR family helix-turn-helix protein/PAS domain S-box-containing protein
MVLRSCQVVEAHTTKQQVADIFLQSDADYLVLTDNTGYTGLVVRDRPESPVPIAAVISPQTELAAFAENLALPALVVSEHEVYGVLDEKSLCGALLLLKRENRELSNEIDAIINFSSDEIYVTDAQGTTLRVNRTFEENSGVPVAEVIGRSVYELEKEGIFKPSVARLVLEQKSKMTVVQEYQNNKKVLVTGTPVIDSNGSVSRVIINTRDTLKLNLLKAELDEIENLKERYCQELLELQEGQAGAKNIISKSKAMKQLLNMARKVAEVDSTVLLLGETGVGKGLLAKFIHDHSPRRNNIFVTINCGAIPETLLESELFGYESGAFTGADRKGKVGKIELAHNGTLFLDEIGDLPASLQVKLLHVLQEGSITRVGGNKEIKLNVHFLAATNRSLLRMVETGAFREDLYYRLNVIPLEIPPLRDRSDDIKPLTLTFLEKFNIKYRKSKSFNPSTMSFLQHYHWPGNVRELENLIERLLIVIHDDVIEPYHLPETIKMANMNLHEYRDSLLTHTQPLQKVLDDMEKRVLEKLYNQVGNTYKIAEILKVNQSTVVRKLQKYGIHKI